MKIANHRPILRSVFHIIAFVAICTVAISVILILLLKISEVQSHSNLNTFTEQLIDHPLPQNTSMISSFSAVGATVGMGDNRFYYCVLLVESLEGQENLEQYYRSAKFKPAQSKSSFDEDIPPMKIYSLPISEWEDLRDNLPNIRDDRVFDSWYLNEDNPNCYLVVLKDGAYYSFVSVNPHYKQRNLVE